MFGLLFPKMIDNTYRGQWLALLFFVPVLIMKLMMGFNFAGLNPVLDVRDVLISVDGIPLDTYSAEAASHLVDFANVWGLCLFTITVFGVIALVRYRAAIPLAIFLLAIEQLGRKAMSIAESGLRLDWPMSTGAIINWGFSIALTLALILSMVRRRSAAD